MFQTVNGHERIYMMPYSRDAVMWQMSFPMTEDEARALSTEGSEALKQEGDVRKLIRAVQDARKEKGLSPQDEVTLTLSSKDTLGDISLLISTCKISQVTEDSSITTNQVEISSGNIYFVIG